MGAGNSRVRKITTGPSDFSDGQLVTLDIDEDCGAEYIWDLNLRPLPFAENTFDEIHAYEVLEHIGVQGDWRGWFDEWKEYWRLLKPGGLFVGSVPAHTSMWAWGDPGHTRCIPHGMFVFLDQKQYEDQIGKTAMSDYRGVFPAPYSFSAEYVEYKGENMFFVLRKVVYDGNSGDAEDAGSGQPNDGGAGA